MKPRYCIFAAVALISALALPALLAQENADLPPDAPVDEAGGSVEQVPEQPADATEGSDEAASGEVEESVTVAEPAPVAEDVAPFEAGDEFADSEAEPAPVEAGEGFTDSAIVETPPVPVEDVQPAATYDDSPAPEEFDVDRAPVSADAPVFSEAEEEAGSQDVFEIDREAPPAREVEVEEAAEPKRSFWDRLFGRKPDKPEEEAPEAVVTDAPAEGQPGEAEDAAVEEEELSPEQIMAMQEEVRRQAAEIQAMRSFKQADQAMERDDYSVALTHLNEGISVMPERPQTLTIRENARKKQAECSYRMALNYYKDGQIVEAKDAISRANEYYPADRRASRLGERIAREEAAKEKELASPRDVGKTDEFLDKQARIKAAIKRGRQYMDIEDFDKARYEFRSVLADDPLNNDAIANLKKISEWEYDDQTKLLEATKRDMMAQVREAWNPPLREEVAPPELMSEGTTIIPIRRRRLLDKLNSIVIPQLDFRQANIVDVVQYLVQQSIAGDTKSPATERGVNLILNLKRPGESESFEAAPARGANADPFALEEAAPSAPIALGVPSVTLSLRNILLVDAIKYITEVTGLKYRIEDDVVVITPADVVVGTVITRTYRVQPTIQEVFLSSAPSGEGAGFLDLGAASTTERGDVKDFFVEAGVPFPAGTAIIYKQNINLLIVSNTEENLERLERILATLDVIPTQIEIEARFVEIGQKDLMELGVEWQLTDNWQIAQEAGAGVPVPLSARERVQVNKNNMGKGMRFLSSDGTGAQRGGDMAGILSISSILTNPELTFILHALEQKSGVNLLSAPKVTTKSGANAEIKVVKELIYPTEFTIQELPNVSTAEGVTAPQYMVPGSFQVRDVGVVLNVTPVVSPDGYTIDLTLLPQVVELAEWINYGSTVEKDDGTFQQMNMPQPVFHSRSIATSISIWDGQTIVMGGLITEGQITTEDKVPFLGDIPLIGYLFRSKTSQSEKRNLLIFVTARLVDPAGNKVQTATAGSDLR